MNTLSTSASCVPTLGQVWKDYRRVRKLQPSSIETYDYALRLVKDWVHLPVNTISRSACLDRHCKITLKNGKSMANYVMTLVSTLMNFAQAFYEDELGRPIIYSNPVKKIGAVKAWNPEPPNVNNFIRSADLETWFATVQKLKSKTLTDLFQFLLFTGLRLNEALTLEWETVNLKKGFIKVLRTKNGKPFEVPLSTYSLAILQSRMDRRKSGERFVFPGTRGNIPFGYSGQHQYVSLKSGVTFTPHGLRRTFAVTAAALKIERPIVKRLLNHSDSDVTGIYAVYEPETLRESLELIGMAICQIGYIDAISLYHELGKNTIA